MKIALVAQGYPSKMGRGGIGSQTYAKAHSLAALGHEVFVVSRSWDMERHESSEGNIHVFLVPGMEQQLSEMTEAVQWLTHSIVVAAEIEALLKKVQLDIIEFPEWGAEGYIHLLNRSDWNRIPVVIQLHGPMVMLADQIMWPEKNSSFYKVGIQMEATCVQLADAIYSSSECSAKWVQTHYKPSKTHIPVIHTGVDTLEFAPMYSSKNKKQMIVFTGRLVQNKGVEELVQAAIDLSKEIDGLTLRLLGDGEDAFIHKLKEKARRSDANELLEFAGFVPKENLPAELSKAHVFAAPSYYEGGPGFVYLEAMACGLPVIACAGSGVEEIVEDGVNGYLVPPKNVPSLTDALRKMLGDTAKMEAMGKRAREYVVREADTKYCIQKLEAFYYSVLQKSKAKV